MAIRDFLYWSPCDTVHTIGNKHYSRKGTGKTTVE